MSVCADTRDTGGVWSLIWSMGSIPLTIISALVEMRVGKTRPGQSHSIRWSLMNRVWKCLVRPGVADTGTWGREGAGR